jgi:hypothetical protein
MKERLAEYGYTLNEVGELVSPKGRPTGVRVAIKRGRIRAFVAVDGCLLFSGADIGRFLEAFWLATKLPAVPLNLGNNPPTL